MLYMLGAVSLDGKILSPDSVRREGSGGLVAKPVMGGRQRKESTGEGEEDITITCTLLPNVYGGLAQLEALRAMRKSNMRFPVMRGDGYLFGWYAIKSMGEEHQSIMRDGVGFEVSLTIILEQAEVVPGAGQNIISGLLSLFGM